MARVRRSFPVFLTAAVLTLGADLRVAHAQSPEPPIDWDPSAADLSRDWSDEVPAHVAYATEGTWLERDGIVEAAPFNVPLLTGDRLRTAEGRTEVMFADGSLLSFDRHTEAEFLDDTLLRLDRGTVRIELARGTDGYRVDAAGTTAWLRSAGEFVVDINATVGVRPAVRLLAIRGVADLESNGTVSRVEAGYEAWASADTTPSLPRAAAVSDGSDFARWLDDRRLERTGYESVSYLPTELTSYSGVLDRNGSWDYDDEYGHVWYPRVADEWTPYSTGRWSFVGSYGWTWIGYDRWAWPTHHYGRWGHRRGRYFWIPGRHWAPAWVAWASTPGYFGWVPLGYNNRPLISITIGYSSGWRGWTYHPIDHFRRRTVVVRRGHYLPPRHVRLHHVYTGPSRPTVTVHTTHRGLRGPARSSVAVPRPGLTRTGFEPGTRTTGTGVGPSRTIRQMPARAPERMRPDVPVRGEGLSSGPVRRMDRSVTPGPESRARPRATPRSVTPQTREQPGVWQRGPASRTEPARTRAVEPARESAPQISPNGRAPQGVRPSPRVSDRESPRASAPARTRASAPHVERRAWSRPRAAARAQAAARAVASRVRPPAARDPGRSRGATGARARLAAVAPVAPAFSWWLASPHSPRRSRLLPPPPARR
jgi:hypothetical protein